MNVFWSPVPGQVISPLKFEQPDLAVLSLPVINKLNKCPATMDWFHNRFHLRSPTDFGIIFDEANMPLPHIQHYPDEIFERLISIRDAEKRLYSLNWYVVFVSDEPLLMEVSNAEMAKSEFTLNTRLIPGQFDIGKWVRPIECAFFVDKRAERLKIWKDDPWAFVKFHTDEKVKLNRFHFSKEMEDMMQSFMTSTHGDSGQYRKLTHFYRMLAQSGLRRKFMQKVHENIVSPTG